MVSVAGAREWENAGNQSLTSAAETPLKPYYLDTAPASRLDEAEQPGLCRRRCSWLGQYDAEDTFKESNGNGE